MAVKAACGNGFPLNIPSVIPESGGSGGTSDYSELSNKPSINSVTLSGNKSASDLGLAEASDIPDLATTSVPGIVQPDGTSITIVDGVISAVGGSGGTSDYSELSNKPSINSVTLSGNKSASDLGLAEASDIPDLATTSAPGIVQPDGTSITIVDGVISSVGGSGSGETYSTNETEIGTWLDAPLYRKVKTYTINSSTNTAQLNFNTSNVTICRYEGYLFSSSTKNFRSLPAGNPSDSNYDIECYITGAKSSPKLNVSSVNSTLYSNDIIIGIIEYTKNS